MQTRILLVGAAVALTMSAQTFQRKATIVGGGGRDRGQCTVEVQVDGSAQVEIRGDTAILRNTSGQPAQWRRFECTAPLPQNPGNLQMADVAGRGRQFMVRNAGGAAVIQIDDSEGGPDLYAFDLYWGNPPVSGYRGRQDRDRDFDGQGGFRDGNRFTRREAIQVCQENIRNQAVSRFNTPNITFRRIDIDNNPGRQDWVIGEIAVRRRFGRQSFYNFSCSVNFETGRVRNARIDQFETSDYPPPYSGGFR